MDPIIFPYTNIELTEQVNRIPNSFGLLQAMNLMPSVPVGSTIVQISIKDGVIEVLPAKSRESSASQQAEGEENLIFIEVPHVPSITTIKPGDLRNQLDQVGLTRQSRSLDATLAERLADMRSNHNVTREYLRMGALKGVIKDGRGRVLHDLYSVFGITKKTITFDLSSAGTDVRAKCEEVEDYIRNNLKGETMSGTETIVSSAFFNALINHPKVEKFWLQTQAAPTLANLERDRLGGNWGRVFDFNQLRFYEYKGAFPVRNGSGDMTSEPAVEANKGHAYPAGTQNTFRTYDGPVEHVDFANSPPEADIFVTTKVLDHGAGVEIKGQSNPLPICRRPEVLVELLAG